jgi:hypothetical protein
MSHPSIFYSPAPNFYSAHSHRFFLFIFTIAMPKKAKKKWIPVNIDEQLAPRRGPIKNKTRERRNTGASQISESVPDLDNSQDTICSSESVEEPATPNYVEQQPQSSKSTDPSALEHNASSLSPTTPEPVQQPNATATTTSHTDPSQEQEAREESENDRTMPMDSPPLDWDHQFQTAVSSERLSTSATFQPNTMDGELQFAENYSAIPDSCFHTQSFQLFCTLVEVSGIELTII